MRSMNNGNGESTTNGPGPTWTDPEMVMLRDAQLQTHWWRLV
jgi:hypothetical protein